MPKGGFDNLIALPLQGGPARVGNSVFMQCRSRRPAVVSDSPGKQLCWNLAGGYGFAGYRSGCRFCEPSGSASYATERRRAVRSSAPWVRAGYMARQGVFLHREEGVVGSSVGETMQLLELISQEVLCRTDMAIVQARSLGLTDPCPAGSTRG